MKPDINFEKNPETNQLRVTIKTERLTMESASHSHLGNYKKLFTTPENMLKVIDGNPWSESKVVEKHTHWVVQWDNNNPFSSLAIIKNDTDEFIGHVLLDEGDAPGFAELGYVIDKKFWGQKYGKEAVPVIVQEYAPELVKRNYKLAGEKLTRIEATARSDNPASINLLHASGLEKFSERIKWGNMRHFFFVNTADLMGDQTPPLSAIPKITVEFFS